MGVRTDLSIFMWLIQALSGTDFSTVETNTSGATSYELAFRSGGFYGRMGGGGIVSGLTYKSDPKNNFVATDVGNQAFQESMWLYELGNSLGYQTGNKPQGQDPMRYGNVSEINPDDIGGALVDCVYGGKVEFDGRIIQPNL